MTSSINRIRHALHRKWGGTEISNRNIASESKGGDPVSGLNIDSSLQTTLIICSLIGPECVKIQIASGFVINY